MPSGIFIPFFRTASAKDSAVEEVEVEEQSIFYQAVATYMQDH
jgi:hypothetical protein